MRTAAYVFLCTEEYDNNSWTVEQLIETCPDIVHGTRVALTDGFLLPPDKLEALLPAAMRVECKKHIVSVDCPKLALPKIRAGRNDSDYVGYLGC